MYKQINATKMNGQRIIGILGTQLLKVTLKTRFYLVGNIECGQQTAVSFYYQRTRAFLLLSPACVASQQSYFLAVAHYAYGNKTVNLLNNQTKSGKESIDRILCFPPNKTLFLTLLLTVAFQEFRLFSIHSFLLHLSVDTFVFLIILFL